MTNLGALSHWRLFIVAKLKHLTIMTSFGNFVSWPKIWLMTLPKEHCPTGGVCMVAKLKIKKKPNPYDSNFGTLSVGRNMVNDSPLGALSHWRCVYGSQIKYKHNLTLMTPIWELCQ